MFKKIIIPIQSWLLSQERCVNCGQSLKKGKKEKGKKKIKKVSCQCGRVFTYNEKTKKYYLLFSEHNLKEPSLEINHWWQSKD